jgi:hypothetical protein
MARVFNVSFHKCGTTSMHKALEILGFRSYHWEKPLKLMQRHLDGTIEKEPLFQGDNTAFNDLPIALMYRELHRIFPDGKFIFVRRDRESWVESLRQHLLRSWPVPYPLHTLAYGYPLTASNFDEAVCLRVYDRLCSDILEFFDGSPNFLPLELKDLSWKSLCPFLAKPEPDQAFPWENNWWPIEPSESPQILRRLLASGFRRIRGAKTAI